MDGQAGQGGSNGRQNGSNGPVGPTNPEDQEAPGGGEGLSRRQRLYGMARSARDYYIPMISGSVSQIASGRAFGTDKYDEYGRIKVPKDASITLFPTYTHKTDDGKYHVDIGGWLSCPGLMTRKNRLIFSLVKQIIRYDSNLSQGEQAINNLESESMKPDLFNDNSSETDSIVSDNSSLLSRPSSKDFDKGQEDNDLTRTSTFSFAEEPSPSGSHETTLRERLGYFIARFIANAELTIVVGSEQEMATDKLVSTDFLTDDNGCFRHCVTVDYKPSVVQVTAKRDETIFTCEPIYLVPSEGLAVISDIDDTIKLTGVIGDKRELLKSLLLKDVTHWNIPPMIDWYTKLLSEKVTFHYVSNSPLQLFPIILKYFKTVGLPFGSLHLKQYTGNIISSLMEPSSSRKSTSLNKIITDFPKKKFICIGDSGEYDFESYVSLAKRHPNQILAIYIRYVSNSLSDVDDTKIFEELNRILQSRKIKHLKDEEDPHYTPSEVEDLIDLSETPVAIPKSPPPVENEESERRASRLPPMIPRKPTGLKGTQLRKLPPLPSRDKLKKSHTDTELVEQPPPMPKRNHPTTQMNLENPTKEELFDNLTNIYYSHNFEDLEQVDAKGAEWIQRVMSSTKQLEKTKTVVRFINDEEGNLYDISRQVIKDLMSGPETR